MTGRRAGSTQTPSTPTTAPARGCVSHLIAAGYRRTGFTGDRPRIHTTVERPAGNREAMAAAGLPVDSSRCRSARPPAGGRPWTASSCASRGPRSHPASNCRPGSSRGSGETPAHA
ncbi:hypothetical protein GCM10010286_46230 [Streptomyces toxytricini]|nr:hypothetical protein GCM10010286_46230 [Streptomyces toxytricini]